LEGAGKKMGGEEQKMKNIIRLVLVMLLLSGCEDKTENSYVDANGFRTIGLIQNGLREGKHYCYYSNGNLMEVRNYLHDVLDGTSIAIDVDSSRKTLVFSMGKAISQITIDKEGDTVLVNYGDNIFRLYHPQTKKLCVVMEADPKTGGARSSIEFDSSGTAVNLVNPPLWYLTKKDSSIFDKEYPGWKELVKNAEQKIKDKPSMREL
jgi:hypothetical protein